tara:strand:+ start:1949 stop:3223 length:1275 start_codon:yes stop_codon:yes gene_type:complete
VAKKTYLDFSLFDEIGDAMDLFGNLIRNSFEYDAFAGKDEFPAIVLTPPVPMDVSQIDAFLPNKKDADPTRSDDRNLVQRVTDAIDDSVETDEEEQLARLSSMVEDKIPKFTFKARIIGPNSPHQFLPDPCNQQVLRDLKQQQNAQDIFDMHTTVIAIGATEKPSLGDVVTIKLEGGSFSYNLQTATFVRLISSEDQTIKNLLGSQKNECKVGLSNLFGSGFMGVSIGDNLTDRGVSYTQHFDETAQRLLRPASGRITSQFGKRLHPIEKIPKDHFGVDIANAEGTPILAALAGKVVSTKTGCKKGDGGCGDKGGGNAIRLQHSDGSTTRYLHLLEVLVKKDQQVKKGHTIGLMGTTGGSTGPHLHFEFKKGKLLNPEWHFEQNFDDSKEKKRIEKQTSILQAEKTEVSEPQETEEATKEGKQT